MTAEYDHFAEVYEQSIVHSPIAEQNLPFYVRLYRSCPGTVVELGIGAGRIAIEAARHGKRIIGVDNSRRMLDLCRQRAAEAGVADRLGLLKMDFRDLSLSEPATLIAMPFHTICEIPDRQDRRQILKRIYECLQPGGRFVCDYFTFDAQLAERFNNVPHLEAEYTDEETGQEVLFWTCGLYNLEDQTIRVVAWADYLDSEGTVVRRQYRRYRSCWIEGPQMLEDLEGAGFAVEAVYGDFEGGPLEDDSSVHVWIARKAAGGSA